MKLCVTSRARAPFRPVSKPSLRHAVIAALASFQCVALANPTGGKVVAGSAAIQASGNTLTVRQATDRAIINWQGFSIGKGELTKFIQPGAGSAVLNRVISGNPSALLGRLEANGRVFLINPNGILVGGGAVINTNSFVASTLDIGNAQFMAGGDLNFVGSSTAGITNLGTIQAHGGDVFLIAHSVTNAGAIEAPRGTAGLAAGNEVLLKQAGDERLFVRTTVAAPAGGDTGVDNSGVIAAVQAELKAAGGNVYALAVNNSGAVHATGIVEKDGRILLSSSGGDISNRGALTARNANGSGGTVRMAAGSNALATSSGVIDAAGEDPGTQGGEVTVTGERVALTGNAVVDVSGDAGGGTALIGGGFQGRDASVDNAQRTLVNRNATINADAVTSGDGGTVIVWSDRETSFNGHISARGGAQSGEGGFAEVSGKQVLGFNGTADLGAPRGAPGTLLLDPKNIIIQTFGATTANPADVDNFADTPDQTQTIAPAVLAATNANVVLQANNDILFRESLQLTAAGASLTAQAGRDIQLGNGPLPVTLGTNNGAISLTANENLGVDTTQRDAGAGVLVMQSDSAISSTGGNVLLHLKSTPDTNNTNQFINVSNISAGAGTITLRNDGAAASPSNSSITQTGNGITAAQLNVQAPGLVLLQSLTNNVSTLALDTGGPLIYTDVDALTVNGLAPDVGVRTGAGNVSIRTVTGDLIVNVPGIPASGATGGAVTFDAGGSLLVNNGLRLPPGLAGLFAPSVVDATYRAGNDVTFTASTIRARNLTVTATNGAIAFQMPGGSSNFGVLAQDISPGGLVTLTANGNITGTGTSTITGRIVDITSTTGAIDLDGVANFTRLNASAPGSIAVDRLADNAIQRLGTITSGADITINSFPLFTVTVDGITRSSSATGNVAIKTNGNVQFTPGPTGTPAANARIETGPDGLITFDAGTGQILDGTTPSFVGGRLFVSGRALGGGTTNPLDTQVSRLSARATRSSNFGGFAFFNNNANAAGDVAIGGIDTTVFGILADGTTSGGEAINLGNNGSIVLDSGGIYARNANTNAGSVVVNANGAASDVVSSAGFFGEGIVSDATLNVTAGRDIAVGRNTGIGDLVGRGGVDVNAGRSVFVEGQAKITGDGNANVFVTAADSIIMRPVASGGSAIRSLGSGLVRLIGNTVDLDNGLTSRPVLSTNEAGGTSGSILVFADDMNLAKRADAGLGNVTFTSRTASRPIMVGAEDPAFLSFTDAELDRVTATRLSIGTPTASGGIVVQGPISRPPVDPTYATLALRTGGNVDLNSVVILGSSGGLQLEGRNLQGLGSVVTNGAIFTATENISLSGSVSAAELIVRAPAGNVTMTGDNDIGTLSEARYNREFRLRDVAGGLVTNNFVDGGAASEGSIEVRNGNLVLNPGTEIIFGGQGNSFQLFSDSSVLNNAGAGAIVAETNARWLIYAPTQDAVRLGGLTPDFIVQGVQFPNEPPVAGNALVLPTSAPSGGGTGTGGTGTGGGTSAGGGNTSGGGTNTSNASSAAVVAAARDIIITPFQPTPPPPPPPPPAASAINIPPPPAEFVPAPPRLFREASGGAASEESVVDSLFRRTRGLPNVRLNALDAATNERLNGVLSDFLVLMETELPQVEARMQTVDPGTSYALRVGALQREYEQYKTNALALLNEGGTVGPAVNQMRLMLDNIAELESAYSKRSEETNALNRARAELAQQQARIERERAIEAAKNQIVTNAKNFAGGPIVADDEGRPIVIPGGPFLPRIPPREIAPGVFEADTIFLSLAAYEKAGYSLGKPVTDFKALVTAGGGHLSAEEVGRIVEQGGGNFTPGVVAALVAAGGGNLSTQQISALVAAGGGNISNALTLNSIVNATLVAAGAGNVIAVGVNSLVAAGGGNLVAAGGGNLVAAGGGNLVAAGGMNLVAAGGLNLVAAGGMNLIGMDGGSLVAAGGGNLVAAGGLNFTSNAISSMVAAGGGNLTAQAVSSLVAAGGLNLVGMDGGSLVAAGGGNLASVSAGLVAAGGGNISVERASSLVAAGGGNFNQTFGNLVAAGAGNLAAMRANLVAAGGGNLVAAGGGNVISHNGGVLQGVSGGSGLVQSGGFAGALPTAGFNPAANFQNFRP